MAKKIVYIVLGALLIFGLLFLLWSWLFSGGTSGSTNTGLFGTASDTSQTSGTTVPGGNYTTTLGQGGSGQNAANGSIPLNGSGGNGNAGVGTAGANNSTNGSGTNGAAGTGATLAIGGSTVSPNGVVWLGGGSGFTPTDINSLSSDAGGFTPTITTAPASGSGGTTLLEALAATAIAGSIKCALPAAVAAIWPAGTAASAGAAAGSTAYSATGAPVSDLGTHQLLAYISGQQTTQAARNAVGDGNKVLTCLINVIAKTALQQITISVVNWINSGFNGQPSFVSNFQQFFTNVADLSAGQFIQGSGLAFLCSPFKLQIKVAIAQSYANRGAQSCSLTGIIKNITNFMNGSFTQGGWPGLLQFTTVPTNNPYGAFAYAQVGLATAQSNATTNAKNNISPTGFLSVTQQTCNLNTTFTNNSNIVSGQNSQAAKLVCQQGCTCKVSTPGSIIEGTLQNTLKSPIDQLGLASDIDQIISALTTQLVTKTLQSGLGSLSQTQGTTQTAADLAAQQQAASLLIDMQGKVSIAQQIGTVDQGSISDVETAQSNLNSLANCWSTVASSTSSSAALATQNAANANSTLKSLQSQIDSYNNDITNQNAQIATLDAFETQMSSAASDADVASAAASYNAAVAAGTFATQADVTTAQQNRVTLQSQMGALNQQTATGLAQCQATH